MGILLQRWDPITKFTFVSDKSNQNYPFRVDLGRTVNHINRGQPCKFEFTESKELFDFLILFDFLKYRLERPQRVQENFSIAFDTVNYTSRLPMVSPLISPMKAIFSNAFNFKIFYASYIKSQGSMIETEVGLKNPGSTQIYIQKFHD